MSKVYYGEMPEGMSFRDAKIEQVTSYLKEEVERKWGVHGYSVLLNIDGKEKYLSYAEDDKVRDVIKHLESGEVNAESGYKNDWLWYS